MVGFPTRLVELVGRIFSCKLSSQVLQLKHELGLKLFLGQALLAMRPSCFIYEWLDGFPKFHLFVGNVSVLICELVMRVTPFNQLVGASKQNEYAVLTVYQVLNTLHLFSSFGQPPSDNLA